MKRRKNAPDGGRRHGPKPQYETIYGIHAVRAALVNPARVIHRVFATRNGLDRVADGLDAAAIKSTEVTPADLTRRLGRETVHQGVMLEADPLEPPGMDQIVNEAISGKPLILLDQVTDPQNVGAILRSAAAFNAGGVVMTRRNSPPLDGALAKAASGAVEHVPVLHVANLARALDELGARGVQRLGLDGGAAQPLETAEIRRPLALVLGAEHKGLRRLTAENCDLLCRLTTPGPLASLNVSNAAAVALHAVVTRQTAPQGET